MSTSKPYDYAVVIGRFQPFHNGHAALIRKALDTAERVIVVIGSAGAARNCKNPFTADERRRMIDFWAQDETGLHQDRLNTRLEFVELRDHFYNDTLWIQDLQQRVLRVTNRKGKVALVGFRKDNSSFYLSLFPSWDFVGVEPTFVPDNHGDSRLVDVRAVNATVIDATYVRELWFENDERWQHLVPLATRQVVKEDIEYRSVRGDPTCDMKALREQYAYLQEYPKLWGRGPFVTVDAVVTMKGHALLIERGQIPGKGLLAFPGGFLNPTERLLNGAIRELQEETGLSLFTPAEIRATLVAKEVFDHPQRSERGRTITHAFHFDFDRLNYQHLPFVEGADDASKAMWVPLYEAMSRPGLFYEDHASILTWAAMRASGDIVR